MFCNRCGHKNELASLYCSQCGAALKNSIINKSKNQKLLSKKGLTMFIFSLFFLVVAVRSFFLKIKLIAIDLLT